MAIEDTDIVVIQHGSPSEYPLIPRCISEIDGQNPYFFKQHYGDVESVLLIQVTFLVLPFA